MKNRMSFCSPNLLHCRYDLADDVNGLHEDAEAVEECPF
eukprot:CAMPEP_0194340240 /NCGR_PEP_ID=MMETSP0171-20130528/85649_1 /TAXON_ID=218684 /ORGANISM="Corethron pennatum, Strain L29A3" /LENGTH=38 /DNA_ID= /DNA_START= /DNA_END= /DNA_ORIENTATION=